MFSSIDKAIIAFLAPFIVAGLAALGIPADATVGDAVPLLISALVTALMVWLVPNRKV